MGKTNLNKSAIVFGTVLLLGSTACGVSKTAVPEKLNISETPSEQITPETIYPTTTPLAGLPTGGGAKADIYSQDAAWWFAEVTALNSQVPVTLIISGQKGFGIDAELLSPTLATFKTQLSGGDTVESYRWYKASAKAKFLLAQSKAEIESLAPAYELISSDFANLKLTTAVRIHVAMQGLRVEAFDKDLTSDETLGSASTDSAGQSFTISNQNIYAELGMRAAPRHQNLTPIVSLMAADNFPAKFTKGFVSAVADHIECPTRSGCVWAPKVFSSDFDVANTSIIDMAQAALREISDLEISPNVLRPQGTLTELQISIESISHAPFPAGAQGWHPRAVVSHADRDTFEAAKTALAQAASSAQAAGAFNNESAETLRTVVKSELEELVAEMSKAASPRLGRMIDLFALLLGSTDHATTWVKTQLPSASQLGAIAKKLGSSTTTDAQKKDAATFTALTDEVKLLQTAWLANCAAYHGCFRTKTAFSSAKVTLLKQNLEVLRTATMSSGYADNSKLVADLFAFADKKGSALLDTNTDTDAESFRTQLASLQSRIEDGESPRMIKFNMQAELNAMTSIAESLSATK